MSHKHQGKLAIEYSLPPGTELLHFPRSDGDSALWPPQQEEIEDEDGNVNFYMPLPDDKGTSLKWLHGVGQKVADEMGLSKDKKYAFANWPDGYKFFDHHKGARASPRHDPYLIGCTTVNRFRSIPEIVPHALWLMTDPTMNRANCECKYCSKRKQSAVSQQFGYVSQASRGSAAPTASQSPSKRKQRSHQPYAVLQRTKALKAQTEQAQANKKRKREKAQENLRTSQLEPPRETVPNESIADLRAANMRLGAERTTRRFHRQGELVWCMLSAPIRAGPPGIETPKIDLWPAIIREWATVPSQVPRMDHEPSPPGLMDAEMQARIDADRPNVAAGHYYSGENQAGVAWTTVHRTQYRAQLLAINADVVVLEDCVLPYAAWAPDGALLAILRDLPHDALQYSRDFCPPDVIPENTSQEQTQELFTRAAAPFSVALEAAAELASTWSVTDEWTAETVNASGGEEEETRFQGLWWGPERIWVGDLVQLKMPRKQLQAPLLHDPYKGEDHDKDAVGTGDRGVFMHLRVLRYVEVVLQDNTTRKQISAAGELYEVADDPTWIAAQVPDENGDEVQKKIVDAARKAQEREVDEAARGVEGLMVHGNGNGKGKEREDAVTRPTSDVAPAPTTAITLPNPDSTVPIDQTVSAMRETLGDVPPSSTGTPVNGAAPPPRTDIGGLSGPANVEELLPPAPFPFAFRPLLTQAGHEVEISLDLLGGRYYPKILQHPLLSSIRKLILEGAFERPEDLPTLECEAVLALEGISPGLNCAMSPTRHCIGRKSAIIEAESRAVGMLQGNWTHQTDGVQGMNRSQNGEMQRGGTWPATTPEAPMAGDGNGMDVDLPGF